MYGCDYKKDEMLSDMKNIPFSGRGEKNTDRKYFIYRKQTAQTGI